MSSSSHKTKPSAPTKDIQRIDIEFLSTKNRFFSATFEMGWQLALIVLIPLIAGIKLDELMDSSISYTLAGFVIAVSGAAAVVWKTVKQVTRDQIEIEQNQAKTPAEKRKEKL